MQVDTFGVYVRRELEYWGQAYALHRECDYLGPPPKNLLAVLIEHQGDMPGRSQGYKPLGSDCRAQFIEDVVAGISRDNGQIACSLRAYYCGRGRKKVERYETVIQLLSKCGHPPVSVRQYLALVELGFQRVRGTLEGVTLVA
jgi:hypothetical protein